MKKSDLKTGMILEIRNPSGELDRAMVLIGCTWYSRSSSNVVGTTWFCFDSLDENLGIGHGSVVEAVYQPLSNMAASPQHWMNKDEVLGTCDYQKLWENTVALERAKRQQRIAELKAEIAEREAELAGLQTK